MKAAKALFPVMDRCNLASKVKRWKKALDPYIARDAHMKLYPSISVEDGEASLFEVAVENWDAEIIDLEENVIPYWRSKYLKQVQCTGNFKAKHWGTVLEDGKHHYSHFISGVVETQEINMSSIMVGSNWGSEAGWERAPGLQSLGESAKQPPPTCDATVIGAANANNAGKGSMDSDGSGGGSSSSSSSAAGIAVVSGVLALVLVGVALFALLPGCADKCVALKGFCCRSPTRKGGGRGSKYGGDERSLGVANPAKGGTNASGSGGKTAYFANPLGDPELDMSI
jgi:hypothetical protein